MENKQLETISKLIIEFSEINQFYIQIPSKVDMLKKACYKIAESWSGSFAGYHGRLYFKNFERPSIEEQFNIEWGGIRGIPLGWSERSAEDIKGAIEKLTSGIDPDKIEKDTEILLGKIENLKHEIVINLASFNFESVMENEKGLLANINNYKFGKTKNEFIVQMLPKGIMTRDSKAAMQGICLPAHIYYECVGYEAESVYNSIQEFLKLSERLVRQIELKSNKPTEKASINNSWNYSNPFWLLWKTSIFMFKKIKQYKIVAMLLLILTLVAIDYKLVWENLLRIRSLIIKIVFR